MACVGGASRRARLCAQDQWRGVRELAELAGDEIRGLLADVDGVVADPLEAARDEDHPQPPLPHLEIVPEIEQAVDDPPVRAVDQLVQVEERLGCDAVALLQRAERDADHLLGALSHLLEALEQRFVRLQAPSSASSASRS